MNLLPTQKILFPNTWYLNLLFRQGKSPVSSIYNKFRLSKLVIVFFWIATLNFSQFVWAELSLQDVAGTWANDDSNTTGMTRIILNTDCSSTVFVHGYGSCSPEDCDWGTISAEYTGNPFTAHYDHGFKTNTLTIQLTSAKTLYVHSVNVFPNDPTRNYEADYYFHPESSSNKSYCPTPEIELQGHDISIPNGDTSSTPLDGTDFGHVVLGDFAVQTFTIQNTGEKALNLANSVSVIGADVFSVLMQPLSPVSAKDSTSLVLRFAPTSVGTFTGTVKIDNDDPNENPYTFLIQGSGQKAQLEAPQSKYSPEIDVQGNGISISHGDITPSLADNTDFGLVYFGSSPTHPFTLYNQGEGTLKINSVQLSGTGCTSFSITPPLISNLGAGESTSFQVTFSPGSEEIFVCTIKMDNNDDNENPYTFNLTGTGQKISFNLPSSPVLPSTSSLGLSVEGTGEGKVTSLDGLLDCTKTGGNCQATYATGSHVKLTPVAGPGSYFSSWGGHEDCNHVQVQLWGNRFCKAYFHQLVELTVDKIGAGSITSHDIHCGKDCSEFYLPNTLVTLTAKSDPESVFKQWKGACTGTSPEVSVKMDQAKTCTALFLNSIQSDFFYASKKVIPVSVKPNQLGVLLKEEALPKLQLENFAQNFKLTFVKKVNEQIAIFELPQAEEKTEAEKRFFLTQRARELKQNSTSVAQAGLVVVPSGLPTGQVEPSPMIMSDELIAHFKPEVDENQVRALNQQFAVEIIMENPFLKNQFLLRVTENTPATALEIANLYEESGLTEYTHPNFIQVLEPRSIPSDPLFVKQWYHHNTGTGGRTVDADVDAPEAWDLTVGDPSVVIAVIDNGFDMSHPDLTPNYWTNPGEIASNGIDDDGNGYVDDVRGWDFSGCSSATPGCGDNDPSHGGPHGTAVASVAAAQGNNELGITGSCQECTIMPLRFDPFSTFSTVLAFGYAKQMGATIITNSWGYRIGTARTTAVGTAINDAAINGRGGLGSVVLFAMDNTYYDNCIGTTPDISSLPNVIAISRSTDRDTFGFSGYGNCMDLLAPSEGGGRVSECIGSPLGGYINCPDRSYNPFRSHCRFMDYGDYEDCFMGTSFSTPLTAGVTGLILSAKSDLTRLQVQRLLQDTADKIEPSSGQYHPNTGFSTPAGGTATHGYGRVNAFEAVRTVAETARNGVDIFLRDNDLDWGNTEQPTRDHWWESMDIKVDAPPSYQPPPVTGADFDALVNENPNLDPMVGADPMMRNNRVYVRVHNRGPVRANSVTIKLFWTQFGSALPRLPEDFWPSFPGSSSGTGGWHPLNCMSPDSPTYCSITNLDYSGSSVAGTPDDAAQIVTFDFPPPPYDTSRDNHFCLVAMVDSPQDRILPLSGGVPSSLDVHQIVDELTPRDNNVTHRNYHDLDTSSAVFLSEKFLVRNPFLQPIQSSLRLKAPQDWKIKLDQSFGFDEVFSLKPLEEVLVNMTASTPKPGSIGQITVIQTRKVSTMQRSGRDLEEDSSDEVMGGITIQLRPFTEEGSTREQQTSADRHLETLTTSAEVPLVSEPSRDESSKTGITHESIEPVGIAESTIPEEHSVVATQTDVEPGVEQKMPEVSSLETQVMGVEEMTGMFGSEDEHRTPEISSSMGPVQVPICPTEGLINWSCNAQGQTLHHLTIGKWGNISNGFLVGTIDNQGWVSNLTIDFQAMVTGGTVTGYIFNQGTIADITFVGAMLQGGALVGTILNESQVGGTLVDVTFAPNARLKGGKLQGQIRGDQKAPALLENVKVLKGSVLSGVKLGQGVLLEERVQVE